MEELDKSAQKLKLDIDELGIKLRLPEATEQLKQLKLASQSAVFWDDPASAQATMKQISQLETKVKDWQALHDNLAEVLELIKLNDESLLKELTQQLGNVEEGFNQLKSALKLAGPYDDHDALVSISAGAGGTDAQDWAQMLMRMYSRYSEKNGWKVTVINEAAGEEAGLKSVLLSIHGRDVYGKLKGEHGVHRLVRLSPFNADNLRQTSFAKVEVIPKIDQTNELAIDDKDLKIDVFRSGGHGGQSVNTTDSAVRITHIPTGISVNIQNERSQLQNRDVAMTILRSKLSQLQLEQHQEKLSELKGPNQSAEWGNQIRSYVLHPYKQVKDLRTKYETSNPDAVLDGELEPFIQAYLDYSVGQAA